MSRFYVHLCRDPNKDNFWTVYPFVVKSIIHTNIDDRVYTSVALIQNMKTKHKTLFIQTLVVKEELAARW